MPCHVMQLSAVACGCAAPVVQVEEVFAAGDLPKVADMLASMRKSLNLVR